MNKVDTDFNLLHWLVIHLKMIAGVVALILTAILLFIWWTQRTDRQMRDELLQQARTIMQMLNTSNIKVLSGAPSDLALPEYLRLKKQLSIAKYANQKCRFLYLMGRKSDGKIFFYVDSEHAESKDYSPPGQIYEEVTDAYRNVFHTKMPAVEGPITDRWGTWMSALIPLTDPVNGKLVAVLGIDIDAFAWKWEMFSRAALPVGLMLAVLTLMISGMVLIRPSENPSLKPIQRRLLIPLAIVLLIMVSAFGTLLVKQQQKNLDQSSRKALDDVVDNVAILETEQAQMLDALGQILVRDAGLHSALKARDRERLMNTYEPMFAQLDAEHGLTHFDFIDADRVCIHRFHKPEMYGDLIDRSTIREVERTGKAMTGIEVGPMGTFTMRSVHPVYDGGTLVGYIELGKEMGEILDILHGKYGVEIALAIRKDVLDRDAWQEGMKMLGRESDWNRFSDNVMIYSSLHRFPAEAESFEGEQDRIHGGVSAEMDFDGKSWRVMSMPLKDVSGAEVGSMILMQDITDAKLAHRRMLEVCAGLVLLLLAWLFVILFVLLRRTDRGIVIEQASLLATEERYKQLAEQSRTIAWEVDEKGLFTYVGHVVEDVLGYRGKELVGIKHFYDLHPEDGRELFKKAAFEVFNRKEPFVGLENRIQTKNGRILWGSTNGIPILDANGVLLGYCGSDTDITERKMSLEALNENEANFRAFFESIGDFVCVATPDWRIIFTNKVVEHKLGYSAEELLRLRVLDLYPAEKLQETEVVLAAILRGEMEKKPLSLVAKNGATLPVETIVWLGRWNGVNCLFVLSKDLSMEKEAQQRFELLFRNNPALMALSTIPDQGFSDVNDAFLKTLGYTKGEIIGKTAEELNIFPNHEQQSLTADQLQVRGHVGDIELQVRNKNGNIIWGLFSGDVISTRGQQYFLTVMIDITARKLAEEKACRFQFETGRLLAQAHRTSQLLGNALEDRKKSEEALKEERTRLSRIIKGTNVGTWEWNIQTGETIFNERWAEIIGYTLKEIAPVSIETWSKYVHPDDLKASNVMMERHFKRELDSYDFECRMKHKDGRWIWVLERGCVSSWTDDGRPLLMFGTHQDITERKLAEESLLKQMDELQLFHRLSFEHELTMFELKKEVNALLKQAGKEEKYIIKE
jgi:PAS domain S-box-containing protein